MRRILSRRGERAQRIELGAQPLKLAPSENASTQCVMRG